MTTVQNDKSAPIKSAVEDCLRGFCYTFLTNKRGTSTIFESLLDPKEAWRSQFLINEEEQLLRLIIFLTDDWYPDTLWTEVMELGCRVDRDVVLGGIVVDVESKEVVYRASVDFRHIQPTPEIVADMLNTTAFPLRLWDTSFRWVRKGGADPKTALEGALISLDAA